MPRDELSDILCSECGDSYVPEYHVREYAGSWDAGVCSVCQDIGYGWRPNETGWDRFEPTPGQLAYLERENSKDAPT